MARFRVTVRTTNVELVEAENPYQAAIAVSQRHGGDVEVSQVERAVGRTPPADGTRKTTKKKRGAKKAPAKKRRRLSPEARAKLAQNLVKARAARAAKQKKAATKKRTAKKKRTTKRTNKR
jgi:hypothetical protein